jgi:hypothetical protein
MGSAVAVHLASPEIVARFDEGFGCWNRGELPEMMEGYAPDAVVDFSGVLLDEAPQRGREAIGRFYDRIWQVWSGLSWQPQEVVEAAEGVYVVVIHIDVVGKRSGLPLADTFAMLYRLGEEGVTHASAHPSRERALEAAESQLSSQAA